jgi:hypothetical protein
MLNATKGTFYYAKDCQHVKNELFYVYGHGESALDRVMKGVAHEGLKKVIQLAIIFYLL